MIIQSGWRMILIIGVGLLIAVILNGCNQSASPAGESIDSALGQLRPEEETLQDRQDLEVEQAEESVKTNIASEQTVNVESGAVDPAASNEKGTDVQGTDGDKDAEEREIVDVTKQESPSAASDVNKQTNAISSSLPEPENDPAPEPENSAANDKPAEESTDDNDTGIKPEQLLKEERFPIWEGDNRLTFSQLYSSFSVRGVQLSDKVKGLTGKKVEMKGYMAPPLKAELDFFVLTKIPLAVCPFCSSDADWPSDIVVIYLPDGKPMKPTEHPVMVTGSLDSGVYEDEETGFVSLIRIYADKVEVVKD